MDGVQFVFAGSEIYFGTMLSMTGIGAIIGVPMVLNGIDDQQSAMRRLLGDEEAVSGKYAAAYWVASNFTDDQEQARQIAMYTDIGGSLVAGGGLIGITKTGRRVLIGTVTAGAVLHAPDTEAGVLSAVRTALVRSRLNNLTDVSRSASREQRDILARHLRDLRASGAGIQELRGTRYGVRRLWQRGYDLLPNSLHYGVNHGIDLAFSKTLRSGATRYAVLEAKAGRGYRSLRGLSVDRLGMRQATQAYNQSRLLSFLQHNPGDALAMTLLIESRANRLRSFASFLRNDRLFIIPQLDSIVRGVRL